MKYKIVLLDANETYIKKVADYLNTRCTLGIEAHSFTDATQAVRISWEIGADLLIAGEGLVPESAFPECCSLATFVNGESNITPGEIKRIARFQKLENLAADMIACCVPKEQASGVKDPEGLRRVCRQVAFLPCGGGSGGSTMAAACALFLRQTGQEVLYLNLERYGSARQFFSGEGKFNFSDVIFSAKSRRAGLEQKIERTIQRDESGVFFVDSCRVALDLTELLPEEMRMILEAVVQLNRYDWIVWDLDAWQGDAVFEAVKACSALVLVSDGTENAERKIEKIQNTVELRFTKEEVALPALFLLYNKFSNKTGRPHHSEGLALLGGAPRFEGASSAHLARKFAQMELFGALL